MDAPFGRTGGKSKSYKKLIELFPQRPIYVEVFGGSGIVLLNKPRVANEVFNDIEHGLYCVYRCLQDPELLKKLVEKLEATIHSREFWYYCKDAVGKDTVDKAFNWYYVTRFSFGQQGRAFGRSLGKQNGDANKIISSLNCFSEIHRRLRGVTVENKNFTKLIREYDSKDTLFYLDPPYLGTCQSIYKHKFREEMHRDLLRLIGSCKGTFALSGYSSELYESQDFWTDRYQWDQHVPIRGSYRDDGKHDHVNEVVWIKE